eukprot:6745473-Prymnesium_polylepis.1
MHRIVLWRGKIVEVSTRECQKTQATTEPTTLWRLSEWGPRVLPHSHVLECADPIPFDRLVRKERRKELSSRRPLVTKALLFERGVLSLDQLLLHPIVVETTKFVRAYGYFGTWPSDRASRIGPARVV